MVNSLYGLHREVLCSARSIGRPLMGGLGTVESRRSNQFHTLPLNMDDEWCVQLFVCSAT
jgi:hypothetical protein